MVYNYVYMLAGEWGTGSHFLVCLGLTSLGIALGSGKQSVQKRSKHGIQNTVLVWLYAGTFQNVKMVAQVCYRGGSSRPRVG